MRLSASILFSLVAAVLAVGAVSGCRQGGAATCLIDVGAVLRDVKVTDVQDPEVVAWTRDGEEVVVTGRRDGLYAVIVAERYPASETSRWSLTTVSIMRTDGDVRVFGDRDYDHRPTPADINAFLRKLGRSGDKKFVFKAIAEQDQNIWQVEDTEIPLYHSSTADPASGNVAHVEYCGARLSRGLDHLHLIYRPGDFPDRNPGFAKSDAVTLRGLDRARDFGAMEGRDYWISDVEVTRPGNKPGTGAGK